MPRLLLKITLFVTGLVIFLNTLGLLADKVAPLGDEFIYAEQDYRNLLAHKDEIQAISIGNSHSAAIDFAEMGIEGQVLTRAGADLFEVERYINNVANKLPNLETVFISLSYYSFSRDNVTLSDMKSLRIQLYTMLPIWLPIQGDGNNLVLGKLDKISRLLSVVRSDHWRNIILPQAEFGALFEDSSASDSNLTAQASCPYLSPDEMENHAQEIAGKNVTSTQRMAALHPNLPDDALTILAKTIEYLQARDVAVVLYTPPYYEAYTTHFMAQGSDIRAQMYEAVNQLQDEYHITYYDFSTDPDLVTTPELFFNSDHINACGSKIFSERLLQAMQTVE